MKDEKQIKAAHKQKLGLSNKIFYIFNTIFWIIVMIVILYPLYLVLIASISNPDAITRGEVIWHPVEVSLRGYKAILGYSELLRSYFNSIVYTLAGVIISIVVTLSAAYTLSRPKFSGKTVFNMYFVFTMFFSGGLIPTFLVMKDIGLYNNPLIIVLMGSVTVWNLMVARTYIQTSIPHELYEAAMLDGANHFDYFFRVVLPLSKTIVAVLAVYYGVAKWNDYFTGLVYIRERSFLPLQTILREILATLQVDKSGDYILSMADSAQSMQEALKTANVAKYCIIVVSTGPVVVLYMFMQKYFEKGVMIGSLKG
ncbi:carbohydrate ABC transporter permease [Eisenbergiella sp.]